MNNQINRLPFKSRWIKNKDCLEGLKKLPDKSIQLVITSPPYNMADGRYYKNSKDKMTNKYWIKWITSINKEVHRVLKDDGVYVLNLSYNKNSSFSIYQVIADCEREVGFIGQDKIAWLKRGFPINSKRYFTRDHEDIFIFVKDKEKFKTNKGIHQIISNVWSIENSNVQKNSNIDSKSFEDNINNACFPLQLPKEFIEIFTDEGDVVCDIFSGLSTTGIACLLSDRKYVGFEVDKQTYELSLKRISQCKKEDNTWFMCGKDRDKLNKKKDKIKIYQYQDDYVYFNKDLWYLDKKDLLKKRFMGKGYKYV